MRSPNVISETPKLKSKESKKYTIFHTISTEIIQKKWAIQRDTYEMSNGSNNNKPPARIIIRFEGCGNVTLVAR